MATKLDQLRRKIDKIDKTIIELLDQRADLALEIGEYKRKRGLAYYDPARQKMILRRIMERGTGKFPRTGLKAVFTEVMSHCLALEKPVRVAYFGQPATFTHIAARTEFGSAAEYMPPTFHTFSTSLPLCLTSFELSPQLGGRDSLGSLFFL